MRNASSVGIDLGPRERRQSCESYTQADREQPTQYAKYDSRISRASGKSSNNAARSGHRSDTGCKLGKPCAQPGS